MLVVALIVLAIAALGVALAARGVRGERRAADARVALAEEAGASATDRLADAEDRARRAEERAMVERGARARTERAARMEREWARELRSQVASLHRRSGLLGEGDPRTLVLELAMELTDATKGLLLERRDADGDGLLDLVCSRGFDADPERSAVVQRLARASLRADETLRDDEPADDELESLVALPVVLADELHGILVCANRPGGFEELDDDVLIALGDHAGAVLENGRLQGELRGALLGTVRVLAAAIEARDPPLRGHGDEVARLVGAVADRLGVPSERREALVVGSLLHDVGKLAVPEQVLGKPGPLDARERALVERHAEVGRRLVEHVPALRGVAPAIGHHHERFDGTGYPGRLAGEDIPLEARIVGIVDAYSAMIADRPYRAGMPPSSARAELERCAGTHFDPDVVRAFVAALVQDEADGTPVLRDDRVLREALEAGIPALAGQAPPLELAVLDATDPVTLLRSHRHLHEVAAVHATRAAGGGAAFDVVAVRLLDLHERNRGGSFAAGDEELRRVAAVLSRLAAERPGAVAARLGGSTLALLAPVSGEVELGAAVGGALGPDARVAVAVVRWLDEEPGHVTVDRAADAARVALPLR